MSTAAPVSIGVGFDTARYGHHVSFLRTDRQPAAKAFTFTESSAGYSELRQAFEQLQHKFGDVHFVIRIDAAGQYAANLERFLRTLPCQKTISVGQPKQNRDYRNVHFPKRKADAVDAQACARFAIVEQPSPTPETPPAFAQLHELAGALERQVRQNTRLVNQLHNRLARTFPELALHAPDLAARWVLQLLEKYPSPAKIAAAHLSSLVAIPHLTEDKARKIQAAAQQTVASLQGPVVEEMIRQSVRTIRHGQKTTCASKRLLEQAYDALPAGPHRQIETIPGIGKQTAAALVAKIIHIERFATPGALVNYFGIFPEENASGVDKFGRPVPPGTMFMSRKGNDLVRRCLWNAAKSAIVHNPDIRALYARQRASGKRGDVALGRCMQKLVHLAFAVWKTDQPFVARHTGTDATPDGAPTEAAAAAAVTDEKPSASAPRGATAGGRKGQGPERQAVTPAPSNIPSASPAGNTPGPAPAPAPPIATGRVDFAQLRKQITMEQILRELHAWDGLKGHGAQRRGPCPIHEPARADGRSFSVNLHKNVFQCFDASCGAKGNVLDLWAQSHQMTIPQAARDLAKRFGINTE
ncbi:MAG TPA: IS110 family transposase [Gemmataceae bacterium]|nr:IS110 family transposase [Gemmataceae bacterium]